MNQPSDPYLRPNNLWTCGGSGGECEKCPGPVSGRCSARPRCQPIKLGERWVSTLDPKLGRCIIGPLSDGQCCQGPGVCSPRLSLRGYRRAFTWCCIALTVAALFCGFAPGWRGAILAPGKLTSQHAQVLAGQGIDRCAACHSSANQPFTQWLAVTFRGNHHSSTPQSELCMKCHGEQISKTQALSPHSLDPAVLAQHTAKFTGAAIAVSQSPPNALPCSTCHREHHGSSFDLSQMSDRQCQTCHASNFHSFESNHLEFAPNYPARRRNRIAFDHLSHKSKHFVDKHREFDCRKCHVGDPLQNVQTLASFESTCQECHQHQIEENEDLAILSLPLLNLDAMQARGANVSAWPISAVGQFDGRIPPLMRVLLSADPRVRTALEQLGSQFQFADIDNGNAEQFHLAAIVAEGTKSLVDELAIDSQATLRRRMALALGVSSEAQPLNEWLATVPLERIQTIKAAWFGRVALPAQVAPAQTTSSLWLPSEQDTLARRRISNVASVPADDQELAPNPLKDKLRQPADLANPQRTSQSSESDNTPRQDSPSSKARTNQSVIPENELLAANPLRDGDINKLLKSRDQWPPSTSAQVPEPVAADGQAKSDGVSDIPPDFPEAIAQRDQAAGEPISKPLSRSSRFPLENQWRIDDTRLTFAYHASQHFDDSLKSLLDLVASSPNKQSNASVEKLFQQLTSDVGVGACGKCHTADRAGDIHSVNWKTVYRDTTTRDFTTFSHQPHLIDATGGSCSSCHQLDETRTTAHQFHRDDPLKIVSNFRPIRKADCAACHQSGLANNSCTECHNYHIGSQVIVNRK